ncbi:MAG: HAD family phosphatase [Aquiluna sp.]|nr:HAD family phosphatase [Aquiluna sp.]
MSTLSLPKAVLWDMDGTLVDSEPYWLLSESALAEDYGKVWTQESGNYLIGKSLYESSAFLKDHLDIKDLSAQQIIDRLTDSVLSKLQHSLPWRPGALELLMELKQAGVKTALVTMSLRRMALAVAEAIPFQAFDVVVAGDDVTHGKPHPEPYEKAAALLGFKPSECIAIEDSTTGLRSAEAAGCLPLGIVNLMPLEQTGTRVIRQSLTGMNLEALRGLM